MPVTATITKEQRDGLYELVRHHLYSIDDLWIAFGRSRDYATAERLGIEFSEDFRLLTDIGWAADDGRKRFELTLEHPRLRLQPGQLEGECGPALADEPEPSRRDPRVDVMDQPGLLDAGEDLLRAPQAAARQMDCLHLLGGEDAVLTQRGDDLGGCLRQAGGRGRRRAAILLLGVEIGPRTGTVTRASAMPDVGKTPSRETALPSAFAAVRSRRELKGWTKRRTQSWSKGWTQSEPSTSTHRVGAPSVVSDARELREETACKIFMPLD